MTYEEAVKYRCTRREAERLLQQHGWTWQTLTREAGYEPTTKADGTYAGGDILEWLGY